MTTPPPESGGSARPDEAGLARATASPPADVRRFVRLGLIVPAPDGTFDPGDATRVRLLSAAERSGIELDDLATAVREGRLSLGFAGELVADAAGLSERTHGEAFAALGFDPETARRYQLAFGLPTARPDAPIREDDLELFSIAARARAAGLPDEPLLRALRAFGISVRQIVEVQRELFRDAVEGRLLASGVERPEMLAATAETRLRLQRMGYRTIHLLLRRFLEQAVFENLVERLEEAHDLRRGDAASRRAIVFLDLSGYTRLTEESGDVRAAEHGGRLVEIATDRLAGSGGRLVKSLGDGVMLGFHDPAEAVEAALDILARAEEGGLPPARAGIAAGPVVPREGDYFGRTVNLAARLVDAADPGRVLVDAAVADAARQRGIAFDGASALDLPGFRQPVPAFLATRAGAG